MTMYKHIVGLTLAISVGGSLALTIGSVQGDVWIERALDLSVAVQLDTATEPTALCAQAELAYGDSPVESRWLRLTAENGAEAESVRLRIVSSAPVNDAVVNLVVQVGCEQKVVRHFLLLPDLPPLKSEPAMRIPLVEQAPAVSAEPAPPAAKPPKPARSLQRSTTRTGTNTAAAAPRGDAQRIQPPASEKSAPATPHLSLQPLAILERRVLPEQASHAPDPGLLAAQEELHQLRQDYQGLQLQAARTEAEFVALRQHLAQAEASRNTIITVVTVGFAALVALTAAGLLWWGRRERARLAQGFDPDAETILSDRSAVPADQWMAPQSDHPAPEEDPPDAVVEIDVALPLGQQTPSRR